MSWCTQRNFLRLLKGVVFFEIHKPLSFLKMEREETQFSESDSDTEPLNDSNDDSSNALDSDEISNSFLLPVLPHGPRSVVLRPLQSEFD